MRFGRTPTAAQIRLAALAERKGYSVTAATLKGCYHLTDNETGEKAVGADDSAAFTAAAAMRFLTTLKDRK